MVRLLGKMPLLLIGFIWLDGLYKLVYKYNGNLIKMYVASDDIYWKGFVVIFVAISIFKVLFLLEHLGLGKEEKTEEDHI